MRPDNPKELEFAEQNTKEKRAVQRIPCVDSRMQLPKPAERTIQKSQRKQCLELAQHREQCLLLAVNLEKPHYLGVFGESSSEGSCLSIGDVNLGMVRDKDKASGQNKHHTHSHYPFFLAI
jgi:hypothetical protein